MKILSNFKVKKDSVVSAIVRIHPPANVTLTQKLGMCPPYFALPHEGCAIDCYSDSQCSGDRKCCFAGCGYTCALPIPLATAKPGQCPMQLPSELESSLSSQEHGACLKECVSDDECHDNKKCCSQNKCDLICVDPVGEWRTQPVVFN